MMRDTRTQHRPPSRQVNDHGRVSGTHRARWDACARARPRQPVHRRLRRDLQNRTHQDPQDTCTHPRGERVRRTLNRHPSTRAPRPHRHLEPTATQKARRRLHRSLQHAPAPPFTRPATTRRHRPPRPARQTSPSRENGPLRRTHQRVPKCRLTSHDTVFGTHRVKGQRPEHVRPRVSVFGHLSACCPDGVCGENAQHIWGCRRVAGHGRANIIAHRGQRAHLVGPQRDIVLRDRLKCHRVG